MALMSLGVHSLLRARLHFVVSAVSLVVVATVLASEDISSHQTWNFDVDRPNSLPVGFQTGTLFDGRPAGEWQVISTAQAKSAPNVLAQIQNKGAEHAYKLVLLEGTSSSNINMAVSFFAVDGKADMGGGLIWRAADDRNYYLTRANPLEQNIRIYHVVKGVRRMLQNSDRTIEVKKWHTFRVRANGCRLQVFYDEKTVFDLCDHTFKEGKIGLWTKSDAITYFDDLTLNIDFNTTR